MNLRHRLHCLSLIGILSILLLAEGRAFSDETKVGIIGGGQITEILKRVQERLEQTTDLHDSKLGDFLLSSATRLASLDIATTKRDVLSIVKHAQTCSLSNEKQMSLAILEGNCLEVLSRDTEEVQKRDIAIAYLKALKFAFQERRQEEPLPLPGTTVLTTNFPPGPELDAMQKEVDESNKRRMEILAQNRLLQKIGIELQTFARLYDSSAKDTEELRTLARQILERDDWAEEIVRAVSKGRGL